MEKRVLLTWIDNLDKRTIEEVYLLDDDQHVFTQEGDPFTVTTDHGPDSTVAAIAGDRVAFQDHNGVFLIKPENIIHIEVL